MVNVRGSRQVARWSRVAHARGDRLSITNPPSRERGFEPQLSGGAEDARDVAPARPGTVAVEVTVLESLFARLDALERLIETRLTTAPDTPSSDNLYARASGPVSTPVPTIPASFPSPSPASPRTWAVHDTIPDFFRRVEVDRSAPATSPVSGLGTGTGLGDAKTATTAPATAFQRTRSPSHALSTSAPVSTPAPASPPVSPKREPVFDEWTPPRGTPAVPTRTPTRLFDDLAGPASADARRPAMPARPMVETRPAAPATPASSVPSTPTTSTAPPAPERRSEALFPARPTNRRARAGTAPRSNASDVQQLFQSLGIPRFEYREVSIAERGEAAAFEAALHRQESDDEFDLDVDHEAFRDEWERERRRSLRRDRPAGMPWTIAVVSLTPGSGRTTVAANLVSALSQEGLHALAVDLDPANALAAHFGLPRSPRIGLVGGSGLRAPLPTALRGSACLPFGACAPERLLQLEVALERDPEWLQAHLVAMADKGCDVAVLDTESRTSGLWRQAVAVADQVLVVFTPDRSPLETLHATEALLERTLASAGRPAAAWLVNRFDGRRLQDRQAVSILRGQLGPRVLPFALQEDTAVHRARDRGELLARCDAGSQVVADFNALADWTIGLRRAALEPQRG